MNEVDFTAAFRTLTGMTKPEDQPFPWQLDLYEKWFSKGEFPDACTLPTGLGKTSVLAIWLIALANAPHRVPRRLVYVVNRRTVVDQTTTEAEKLRRNATAAGVPIPAISTLRGQFADNRKWSADPSKPAIIAGTVDMIGSRLLFSGYGIGFKSRPMHAGFLSQDVLLVHDEAHLEPAFQELVVNIQREQHERERAEKVPWPKLRVMELTATSRGSETVFALSDKDRDEPEVQKRIGAKKAIHLHESKDEKKLADEIAELALKHRESGRAVLVFVSKVDDVEKIVAKLRKEKQNVQQLTGTLRGLERDRMADPRKENACPIFARFLRPPKPDAGEDEQWKIKPQPGTVYLVCTSAGEVGVNISADHLVCDLSTFDSMAQRFGRVNRFGNCDDTRIDVVYPKSFDEKDDYESRLKKTLELLRLSNGNGSPTALGELHQKAMREGSGTGPMSTDRTEALREYILATYAPQPKILPVSDILFDAWALTTIRGKLPGRPMVEPYLHGISEWEPPETHVAWREEVWELRLKFASDEERNRREPGEREQMTKFATELLEDYPLKPHELLRDNSRRVFDRLKKLKAPTNTPVWIVSDDDTVEVTTLAEVIEAGKERTERKTVLLPPMAGGLKGGMLTDNPEPADDVADELFDGKGNRRRVRVWDDDEDYEAQTEDMRLVRRIDLPTGGEDEESRSWHWFELPTDGDTDGSKSNKKPVLWEVHTQDVTNNVTAYVATLPLPQELKDAIVLAAKWHDLGKRRKLFQTILGNFKYPGTTLAKSGKKGGRVAELYRHEFGSLIDVLDESQPYCAQLSRLPADMQDVVLHLIAVHHGYGRPHFSTDRAFDPEPKGQQVDEIAAAVTQRFARLQRRYGRWGLAYLESLLRAADYAASAKPSRFVEDEACKDSVQQRMQFLQGEAVPVRGERDPSIRIAVDPTNPGQYFACCGLLELADRLWPEAEGWFEGREFCITCAGTLAELIRAVGGAKLTQLDTEDDTGSAIEIGLPFRPLRLDWWQDDRAGGKELKVWAGSMESYGIARAMQLAMLGVQFHSPGLFNVGMVVPDPANSKKKKEPYYFDARRGPNAHSRDVGFAPNDLDMTTTAFPAVELLCLVGLQRCLPAKSDQPRVFDYYTWTHPVLPELLRAIVPGELRLPGACGYRFENWYRTGQKKHKAFRSATLLSGGV